MGQSSHCTKCGTLTSRTETENGTYEFVCPECGQTEEFQINVETGSKISVCPICGMTLIPVDYFTEE